MSKQSEKNCNQDLELLVGDLEKVSPKQIRIVKIQCGNTGFTQVEFEKEEEEIG